MRFELFQKYMLPYVVKVIAVLIYFINFLGIPKEIQTED